MPRGRASGGQPPAPEVACVFTPHILPAPRRYAERPGSRLGPPSSQRGDIPAQSPSRKGRRCAARWLQDRIVLEKGDDVAFSVSFGAPWFDARTAYCSQTHAKRLFPLPDSTTLDLEAMFIGHTDETWGA